MFLSISLYFISVFLIWWAFCGYILVIYLFSLFNTSSKVENEDNLDDYPTFTILIPCYNEENLVEQKVDNLKVLQYERDKLKVYFLDGCSTDKTVENLKKRIKGLSFIQVIETGCKGKINQLNYYLPKIESDIILNTDIDSVMNPDVLIEFAKEFKKDPKIYVIGSRVSPTHCNHLEKQYWESQNWFRVLESKVISSSIVVAPCYAFRKGLISHFPDDCVADDIYISYLANTLGKKTIYLENAIAYETRAPKTIENLIVHKFRKANAYIIEILRFLYLLPIMRGKWKMIYLTKVLQIILMPWILVFFSLASISFLLSGIGTIKVVIFSFIFLATSLGISHYIVQKNLPSLLDTKLKRRSSLAIFLITNLVLFLAGISYPFYSQTSSYQKIGN